MPDARRVQLCQGPLALGEGEDAPSARWVLTRPDAVVAAHVAWARAGANVGLTYTAGATEAALGAEHDRLEAICAWSERLARSGGAKVVAGLLVPTTSGGYNPYARAAKALLTAGVDLLWFEGFSAVADLQFALDAARGAKWALTLRDPAQLRTLGELAAAPGCVAVGLADCDPTSLEVISAVEAARKNRTPLVLRAAASSLDPESWAEALVTLAPDAAFLAPGTGTTPAHLEALAARLEAA